MDEKRVLFIGNSHTYYNDMANMFKMLCKAQKNIPDTAVTMLASGGKTLDWHADQPETPFNILYGDYDFTVLQQAAHPFGGKEEMMHGVNRLNEWISKTDSKIVAYMTWAEKRFPENQERMSRAYEEMADELNCILAPVGRVWQSFRKENPDIELYDKDGEHASKSGSFLAACTICKAIFKDKFSCDFSEIKENGGVPDEVAKDNAEKIFNHVTASVR